MHSNDNGFSPYDILVLRDASGEIGVPGLQPGDLLDEVRGQLYRAGLISLTSGNITDAGWAVLRDSVDRGNRMSGTYHGHMTRADGSRVPLTRDMATALWEGAERERAARAEAMPTEADALRQLHQAYTRLQELGWMAPSYAHHKGECDTISLGCSGIHQAAYGGDDWPNGQWWLRDDIDTIEPALVKPIQENV